MTALLEDLGGVSGELERVVVRGAPLGRHVAEHITAAPLGMSTAEVTQLSLVIADVDLELFATRLFALGTRVDYGDLRFRIAAHEVSGDDGGTVTVDCRPDAVRRLRRRRGKLVLRNASPTDFVAAECKAVGVKLVAEPTARRPNVTRDVPGKDKAGGVDEPSSWSTFDRLAREEGFLVFEAAGTIYFGRPTWLLKRPGAVEVPVDAGSIDDDVAPDELPTCRRSEDSPDAATVTAALPLWRADEVRPGRKLRLRGVPTFGGAYLLDGGSFDLADLEGTIDVQASTPEDPEPQGFAGEGGSTTGVAGTGPHKELVDAAIAVGFRGESLIIAVAVALAESGGARDARHRNTNGSTDYGAWQINSVHTADGFQPSRAFDLVYNARWAWHVSDGGRDWSPWVTYSAGTYRQHLATARKAIEQKDSGGAAPGRGNSQQSLDFVTVALAQRGDTYRFGAEVNLSDPDPDVFDCSELIEWACAQVGVRFVDGSANQIARARSITVAEAIRTRGALLYVPGHIAISLGDGRTIEAANSRVGVIIGNAAGRFTRGGLIPGLRY